MTTRSRQPHPAPLLAVTVAEPRLDLGLGLRGDQVVVHLTIVFDDDHIAPKQQAEVRFERPG